MTNPFACPPPPPHGATHLNINSLFSQRAPHFHQAILIADLSKHLTDVLLWQTAWYQSTTTNKNIYQEFTLICVPFSDRLHCMTNGTWLICRLSNKRHAPALVWIKTLEQIHPTQIFTYYGWTEPSFLCVGWTKSSRLVCDDRARERIHCHNMVLHNHRMSSVHILRYVCFHRYATRVAGCRWRGTVCTFVVWDGGESVFRKWVWWYISSACTNVIVHVLFGQRGIRQPRKTKTKFKTPLEREREHNRDNTYTITSGEWVAEIAGGSEKTMQERSTHVKLTAG